MKILGVKILCPSCSQGGMFNRSYCCLSSCVIVLTVGKMFVYPCQLQPRDAHPWSKDRFLGWFLYDVVGV